MGGGGGPRRLWILQWEVLRQWSHEREGGNPEEELIQDGKREVQSETRTDVVGLAEAYSEGENQGWISRPGAQERSQ